LDAGDFGHAMEMQSGGLEFKIIHINTKESINPADGGVY
jgi:hypothetical protein